MYFSSSFVLLHLYLAVARIVWQRTAGRLAEQLGRILATHAHTHTHFLAKRRTRAVLLPGERMKNRRSGSDALDLEEFQEGSYWPLHRQPQSPAATEWPRHRKSERGQRSNATSTSSMQWERERNHRERGRRKEKTM